MNNILIVDTKNILFKFNFCCSIHPVADVAGLFVLQCRHNNCPWPYGRAVHHQQNTDSSPVCSGLCQDVTERVLICCILSKSKHGRCGRCSRWGA